MNVGEWLEISANKLAANGYDAPRLEARILLEIATDLDRQLLISRGSNSELSVNEVRLANELLERRLEGEPLAYIRGTQEFFGREFAVNQRVLIPRQETELLAEAALAYARADALCVDVGTGSGCIGITLSLESPRSKWIASDISLTALEVAKLNANRMEATVVFVNGDLLSWLLPNCVDLIVSNPPYVADDDPHLQTTVRDWEPAQALYAVDGLQAIKSLISQSESVLKPGGVLAFEFGFGQSLKIEQLLAGWRYEIQADLQGMDRFVLARR